MTDDLEIKKARELAASAIKFGTREQALKADGWVRYLVAKKAAANVSIGGSNEKDI